MEFLFNYVKNVCVFTLVITLILNIFPERQNKKYIKLFAGLLLMAVIFEPIVQMKNKNIDLVDFINKTGKGSYKIDFDKDISEIETKIYERLQDGLEEYTEQN